ENILAHPEKVKGEALQKNLREFKEQALLSKHLVTIDTSVPLRQELADLKVVSPDREKMSGFFQEMEFKTLLELFSKKLATTPGTMPAEKRYRAITTDEDFNWLLAELAKQPRFAVDSETTSIDPLRCEIVGMSFSWRGEEAFYLPLHGLLGVELAKLEKLRP